MIYCDSVVDVSFTIHLCEPGEILSAISVRNPASAIGRVTLVIADDHQIVVEGLCSLLGQYPEFEVCGTCGDGSAALRLIEERRPAIAVLDWVMPGLDGIQVLTRLRAEFQPTRVVLLTGSASEAQTARAFAQGASGLLQKESAVVTLVDCLRSVAEGRHWYPTQFFTKPAPRCADATLTGRERQLAVLVSTGLSNKEIARELDLTEGTIKVHLYNTFKKLGISSRSSLASIATTFRSQNTQE